MAPGICPRGLPDRRKDQIPADLVGDKQIAVELGIRVIPGRSQDALDRLGGSEVVEVRRQHPAFALGTVDRHRLELGCDPGPGRGSVRGLTPVQVASRLTVVGPNQWTNRRASSRRASSTSMAGLSTGISQMLLASHG